jgi:hypothetical protein
MGNAWREAARRFQQGIANNAPKVNPYQRPPTEIRCAGCHKLLTMDEARPRYGFGILCDDCAAGVAGVDG